MTLITFLLFTGFVAFYATWKPRRNRLNTQDGYFLGGRSLTGVVIAGSLLLTNISTEHLVGMNGSAYKNGAIIIAWEVTSAIALVAGVLYFALRYLDMGEIISIRTMEKTVSQKIEERYRQEVEKLTFSKTDNREEFFTIS